MKHLNLALTAKLKKLIRPEEIRDLSSKDIIDVWFCNYFNVNRKKWLVLVNAKTFITLCFPEVNVKQMRCLENHIQSEIDNASNILSLPLNEVWKYDNSKPVYGSTFNRRIMGIVTEQIKTVENELEVAAIKGEPTTNADILIGLNSIIYREKDSKDYKSPVDKFKEYFDALR